LNNNSPRVAKETQNENNILKQETQEKQVGGNGCRCDIL